MCNVQPHEICNVQRKSGKRAVKIFQFFMQIIYLCERSAVNAAEMAFDEYTMARSKAQNL